MCIIIVCMYMYVYICIYIYACIYLFIYLVNYLFIYLFTRDDNFAGCSSCDDDNVFDDDGIQLGRRCFIFDIYLDFGSGIHSSIDDAVVMIMMTRIRLRIIMVTILTATLVVVRMVVVVKAPMMTII